MVEEIKFNLKSGRATGALIGFALGMLILFWKVIILIIFVLAGYWIGRIVDNKRNGTVISIDPGRKE